MNRLIRGSLVAAVALVLSACHVDVTYRIDAHANRTATVSIREKYDDQLYEMAVDSGGSDPLGIASMAKAGWLVRRSVDADQNHTVTFAKLVPLSNVNQALFGSLNALPRRTGIPQPHAPTFRTRVDRGFLASDDEVTIVVPPAMPRTATSADAMGEAFSASMIGLHFELRVPGKIVRTNGEIGPDGFVRWDLPLDHQTIMTYAVQRTNVWGYAVLCLAILIAVAAISLTLFRARNARDRANHDAQRKEP